MEYIVHGVTKSQTRLSDFHFSFFWSICPFNFFAFCIVSLHLSATGPYDFAYKIFLLDINQ